MVTDDLSSMQGISHRSKQATFLMTAGAAVLVWAKMAFLFTAIKKLYHYHIVLISIVSVQYKGVSLSTQVISSYH